MKLFLASSANVVLKKIVPMLPKPPQELKVAFIPTARDPYNKPATWVEEDREELKRLGFSLVELDLKNKTEQGIRDALRGIDIIFVAGGNTFYLLQKARESGFDKVARELVEQGTMYIGSSAGSILAGPNIEPVKIFDDPTVAELQSAEGIGLVDFVVLPHFGKEKYGRYHEQVLNEYKDIYKIIPITDKQFIAVTETGYTIIS